MVYTATGIVFDPASGNAVSGRPYVVAYRRDTGVAVETQQATVAGLVTFTALPDGVQCGARCAVDSRRHVEVALTTPIGSFLAATWATTADLADVGGTEAAGSATTVPRGDHGHALAFSGTVGDIAAATANGASTHAARADHAHKIPAGHVTNAMVNASAAIAYSKLALGSSIVSADIVDGTIVNADINASAAIAMTKITIPRAKVRLTANQSLADGGEPPISWVLAGVDYDVGTLWVAGSPTRLTVPTGQAGTYLIEGQVAFAASAAGTRRVTEIWATISGVSAYLNYYSDLPSRGAAFDTLVPICRVVNLNAADYVELRAYHNSGGGTALNAIFTSGGTYLSMTRVG